MTKEMIPESVCLFVVLSIYDVLILIRKFLGVLQTQVKELTDLVKSLIKGKQREVSPEDKIIKVNPEIPQKEVYEQNSFSEFEYADSKQALSVGSSSNVTPKKVL